MNYMHAIHTTQNSSTEQYQLQAIPSTTSSPHGSFQLCFNTDGDFICCSFRWSFLRFLHFSFIWNQSYENVLVTEVFSLLCCKLPNIVLKTSNKLNGIIPEFFFTAFKVYYDLNLVTITQKFPRSFQTYRIIMLIYVVSHFELLQIHPTSSTFLLLISFFLLQFISIFTVIHYSNNRRICLCGYYYQIKFSIFSHSNCLIKRYYSNHILTLINKSNGIRTKCGEVESLSIVGVFLRRSSSEVATATVGGRTEVNTITNGCVGRKSERGRRL
uniref:Transmembrane protein n=1 Tax=Medicago truncatula TaxID=3880 RepID=I3SP33_MEDTR|nr:unknown [Medicago truncatula]